MVSQEIPYPGKRKLRGNIAAKEADVEFQQYLAIQLNVRSRVIQAFHRLHHAYEVLDILSEGKGLLVQVIRVSEARYTYRVLELALSLIWQAARAGIDPRFLPTSP